MPSKPAGRRRWQTRRSRRATRTCASPASTRRTPMYAPSKSAGRRSGRVSPSGCRRSPGTTATPTTPILPSAASARSAMPARQHAALGRQRVDRERRQQRGERLSTPRSSSARADISANVQPCRCARRRSCAPRGPAPASASPYAARCASGPRRAARLRPRTRSSSARRAVAHRNPIVASPAPRPAGLVMAAARRQREARGEDSERHTDHVPTLRAAATSANQGQTLGCEQGSHW